MSTAMEGVANASITLTTSHFDPGYAPFNSKSTKAPDELSMLIAYIRKAKDVERLFPNPWASANVTMQGFSSALDLGKDFLKELSLGTPTALVPTVNSVIDEIHSYLRDYKDGWDGQDSIGPSEAAAQAAAAIVTAIPRGMTLPKPMLSSSGEIGLYWDMDGGYVDISFDFEGKATFFSRPRLGRERFEELQQSSVDTDWYWSQIGVLETQTAAA